MDVRPHADGPPLPRRQPVRPRGPRVAGDVPAPAAVPLCDVGGHGLRCLLLHHGEGRGRAEVAGGVRRRASGLRLRDPGRPDAAGRELPRARRHRRQHGCLRGFLPHRRGLLARACGRAAPERPLAGGARPPGLGAPALLRGGAGRARLRLRPGAGCRGDLRGRHRRRPAGVEPHGRTAGRRPPALGAAPLASAGLRRERARELRHRLR
mmetsp:Transcript_10271/g.20629  ORF Transcript_10271/g.20629 Transcript_10271/m.20629 type:complete len:209 (+) Transcript_10271:129-755(+)